MRLHVLALASTIGLFCGAAILIVASANQISPTYGRAFLDLVASVYPGYEPGTGWGSVAVATLYGFVDGAIGGAVFGWLYNQLAQRFSTT
jgi:hypothetical protein